MADVFQCMVYCLHTFLQLGLEQSEEIKAKKIHFTLKKLIHQMNANRVQMYTIYYMPTVYVEKCFVNNPISLMSFF